MAACVALPVSDIPSISFNSEKHDTKNEKTLEDDETIPTEQLLLSIVRMGSLTSIPKTVSGDHQDENISFPPTNATNLLQRCKHELRTLPKPLKRQFRLKSLTFTKDTLRIFQWNHLSQTLGTKNDNFVRCNPQALDWSTRRWRLLEEIIRYDPDIICLQEVDHYKLLQRALGSIGYGGRFVPKPDSPCLYLEDNNGPDGCAIFYKTSQFHLDSSASHILSVWGVESNQVVLSLLLTHRKTGKELCVATTHLKARTGDLLTSMRNEQGKDILDWLQTTRESRPVIISGDFNADPCEPVYSTMTGGGETPLLSAYGGQGGQGEYTTWKIRETGEQKKVLDYIFHSPQLQTVSTLDMPTEQQIGEDRLPSLEFASDHLSLVADIQL